MNTEDTSKKGSVSVSRRAMLGKAAKYAALVPAASLVVTKANAHSGYLLGSAVSTAECVAEHADPLGFTVTNQHCEANHGTSPGV